MVEKSEQASEELPAVVADESVAKTVEVRGVEVTVEPETLNSWRFIDDLAVAEAGDEDSLLASIRVLRALAGSAYADLRNKAEARAGGRLTIEQGAEALLPLIQEILEAVGGDVPNS